MQENMTEEMREQKKAKNVKMYTTVLSTNLPMLPSPLNCMLKLV